MVAKGITMKSLYPGKSIRDVTFIYFCQIVPAFNLFPFGEAYRSSLARAFATKYAHGFEYAAASPSSASALVSNVSMATLQVTK